MTNKLEIRNFMSWDIDDLSTWQPSSPSDVYIQVEMDIGETGVPGEHLFQALVATPEGLHDHHTGKALESFQMMQHRAQGSGREALIIVNTFDWNEIRSLLENMVEKCNHESWEKSLNCLRKKFFWEYEDIKYK